MPKESKGDAAPFFTFDIIMKTLVRRLLLQTAVGMKINLYEWINHCWIDFISVEFASRWEAIYAHVDFKSKVQAANILNGTLAVPTARAELRAKLTEKPQKSSSSTKGKAPNHRDLGLWCEWGDSNPQGFPGRF